MKIAIASSGLGHVVRGIETWARDTAMALHRRGVDITLYAASAVSVDDTPLQRVPCLRRGTWLNHAIVRLMPSFCWRWGLKSTYALEQKSFWYHLLPMLNRQRIDILHVQDPVLADCCRRSCLKGETATRVILAHGTEEPLAFLESFPFLQHLAPWHLDQSRGQMSNSKPYWVAIPNFVNTDVYRPVSGDDERQAARRHAGLPENACIVGTLAAIKRHHKRIDWLIRAFARAVETMPDRPLHLVVAGSRTPDYEMLMRLGDECCPGRITFFADYPHERVAELLRAFDVFVLASLFEMMPIALLEASASGLPIMTHDHPVMTWMSGDGGIPCDFHSTDAFVAGLQQVLKPDTFCAMRTASRKQAMTGFSESSVIPLYRDYYNRVYRASPGEYR